jgi:hypothetical protein
MAGDSSGTKWWKQLLRPRRKGFGKIKDARGSPQYGAIASFAMLSQTIEQR